MLFVSQTYCWLLKVSQPFDRVMITQSLNILTMTFLDKTTIQVISFLRALVDCVEDV